MQRPRVLLVEDEGLIGLCVADDIAEFGFEPVGPFDDVDTAVNAAKTEVFDFALIDINLKDEMSYAVLDTLMAAGTPTAIMTAYSYDDIPERFAKLPVLAKPYSAATFRAALDKLQATTPGTSGSNGVPPHEAV